MPEGSLVPVGAAAPESRAMNASSSVSISPGLGSGVVTTPPAGSAWHTAAGFDGENAALLVKRYPSRSKVYVVVSSTPEYTPNPEALLEM
jgi:hypothetical protein